MFSKKSIRSILAIIIISTTLLACDLTALVPGGGARPSVAIQSPSDASNFKEGDEVSIQSASTDPTGIVRVELLVDGQVVSTDAPPIPQGQTSFSLVQKWKATAGQHTIGVRAYNGGGAGSDPAVVTVTIAGAQVAQASPTPGSSTTSTTATPAAGSTTVASAQPTNTASAASSQATATVARPTPSRTPTRPAATVVTAAPGIYAVSIRTEPTNPRVNTQVKFYVTLFNNTKETVRRRIFAKIFRPDERNSFGETAKVDVDIPVGTTEFATPDNWKTSVYADCQPFFVRPYWYEVDSTTVTEFLKTDGQAASQGFNVCP